MKYPSSADIAAMKANGYDRSTIHDAEEQAERWPEAEQLCQTIREAFADVRLGDGVGLKQGRGLDDYEDEATCARYRAEDEKEDWSRIPVAALNHFHSSLSFFDAEGMRFHLPAFLIADLHGDYGFGMDFCLTHLSDHRLSQFVLLSDAQRKAVRAFLLFILDDPDYQFDREDILKALDSYWRETN
jgi:hypothetical protein